jgi:hypothetical protein
MNKWTMGYPSSWALPYIPVQIMMQYIIVDCVKTFKYLSLSNSMPPIYILTDNEKILSAH